MEQKPMGRQAVAGSATHMATVRADCLCQQFKRPEAEGSGTGGAPYGRPVELQGAGNTV